MEVKAANASTLAEPGEDEVLFCSKVTEKTVGKIEWESKRAGAEISGSNPRSFPVFIKKWEIGKKAQVYRDQGKPVPDWLKRWLAL